MAYGVTHKIIEALAGVRNCLREDSKKFEHQLDPLIVRVAHGKLPDQQESAVHPNQQQFFHSLAELGSCVYGLKKTYEWQQSSPRRVWIWQLLFVRDTVNHSNLALDELTAKLLPQIDTV